MNIFSIKHIWSAYIFYIIIIKIKLNFCR